MMLKAITPPEEPAPNIAKMRMEDAAHIGMRTLKGPKWSARAFGMVLPKIEAAFRMASE